LFGKELRKLLSSGRAKNDVTWIWGTAERQPPAASIRSRKLVRLTKAWGVGLTPCLLNGQQYGSGRRQIDMATELDRVRELVAPIAADLDLDLYDVERRNKVLRITIDTPPGSEGGISLDNLSLATRLISRELDHEDVITSAYTLEVTSPGLERHLRTPLHFQREVGKDVTVRLAGHAVIEGEERRIDGKLVAADETTATLLTESGTERTINVADVDKARTVFEWGPKPKPGKGPGNTKTKNSPSKKNANTSPKTENQQS
jgi:ribosome maturation factor RimP